MRHHAQLILIFLVEMGCHHIGQASLELLTVGGPPASASQSAGITGMSHCTWLDSTFICSSLQVESWDGFRAYCVCFLSFGDQVPCSLQLMFKKSCYISLFPFGKIVYSGQVSLVPVTVSYTVSRSYKIIF